MDSSERMQLYSTTCLKDIYDGVDGFIDDYTDENLGLPTTISEKNARILYFLLMAKYGNNPIANMDVTQFKMKLFCIIWQYGPTWEKRLEIQEKLRGLTEADLIAGAKQINNVALNPATEPTTGSLEELTYINQQSTNSFKKSKLSAYGELLSLIKTDVTAEFVARFANLFKKFVLPERPALYEQED